MTIENTEQIEVKNPDALLKKNRQLLQELTETKAALQVAQEALGTAQSANEATAAQLHTIRVTDPLARIVATLSPHTGLMTKTLNDLFDVKLDAEHNPHLFDKQGQPLAWTETDRQGRTTEHLVELNQESIMQWMLWGFEGNPDGPKALMFKAQGCGAVGSNGGSYRAQATPPAARAPAPATPEPGFGLR